MPSHGKQLHSKGLRQGSCLPASIVKDSDKNNLYDSRINKSDRSPTKNKHKIINTDWLVVLSQDCDIACGNDKVDPLIELALFKPINNTSLYSGNQYAKSVRKIQLKINGDWFEAEIKNIIWVEKEALFNLLANYTITNVDTNISLTVATWRGNRYSRDPLPDNFNAQLKPHLDDILKLLDKYEKKISGIYVNLNSYDEKDEYTFNIFALISHAISDEHLSSISEIIEKLSTKLATSSNFTIHDSTMFAVRDDQITINEVTNFRKLNLDYISLSDE